MKVDATLIENEILNTLSAQYGIISFNCLYKIVLHKLEIKMTKRRFRKYIKSCLEKNTLNIVYDIYEDDSNYDIQVTDLCHMDLVNLWNYKNPVEQIA